MSNKIIKQKHPLRRNGSTRIERLVRALAPEHFRLDDRSMQDLLVAAHRYAAMLSWVDFDNRPDGDWTCFWETETLTYLAVLAALDLEQLRKNYDEADYALGVLLESHKEGEAQQEQAAYRRLIEILYDMARGLEERYRKLVAIRHPLQNLLHSLIKRDNDRDTEELAGPLESLIALNKGKDDQLDHSKYYIFIQPDNRWGLVTSGDYGRIAAMAPAEYPREQLRGIFVQFYNAYVVLQNRAQSAFDQELARMEKPEAEEYRIVQPHISLFIAFLRLFRHAQDSLNELVGKQLDFYYEEVLALRRAPARPDTVYLIFTLAKNFEPQLVEKGAQLLGGKDKNGRPRFYETVQDWVVSLAKIEEVKSFYVPAGLYAFNYGTGAEYLSSLKTVVGRDYALPLDSQGIRAFSDDRSIEEQEVGFVIASPQLLLQEGRRLIEIKITNVKSTLPRNVLGVQLTGEKGWSEIPVVLSNLSLENAFTTLNLDIDNPGFNLKLEGNTLTLRVFLPKDFPPVVPILGNKMTKWPAVKVALLKEKLSEITVEEVSDFKNLVADGQTNKIFTISVRAEGVSKNLILQTDQGVFNGTQQVMPFGPTAPKGARFHVGFAEAFLKKLDTLVVKPSWVEPKGEGDFYTSETTGGETTFIAAGDYQNYDYFIPSLAIDIEILDGNSFVPAADADAIITFVNPEPGLISIPEINPGLRRDVLANSSFTQYDPSIKRGFLRITFKGDLGHNEFPNILAVNTKEATDPATLPLPPYTPTFNSVELDYISESQLMEDSIDEFFYLHPFGGHEKAEINPVVSNQTPSYDFSKVTLFKDFVGTDTRGYLYIGLSQLKPGSNLSILIQTAEGTERKADVDPPVIEWARLTSHNTWKTIDPDKILLDSTRSLTRTGILQLKIPEDISSEGNTLLNPELLWLRVTATEDSNPERSTAALPDLAYIHAQVVEARFVDEKSSEYSHMAGGLPASTISKLAISRSAVKKIEQPFVSFNGKAPESEGMAFYIRISERLRHRDRAVTVWDYEHLLLEEFRDIAAVKCIPHTQYRRFPPSELAPGYVVVAVIPDLKKRNGASRNQPRFPKGDLDEMRDYLLDRATLFLEREIPDEAALQVINAQYEQIRVEVNVEFMRDIDPIFYNLQLKKDLQQFLSPWIIGSSEPAFGQTLRRSRLIQFMEELYYIDYVDVDNLTIRKDNAAFEGEYILAGAAHGILCSAGAHKVNEP